MSAPTVTQSTPAPAPLPLPALDWQSLIRTDIQGLRAIAVALVLVFHLWPEVMPGGYVGVDVFFVISGFLITAQLLTRPINRFRDLLEFWSRRVRRLIPAAILVLGVTGVAVRAMAPESQWGNIARELRAAALYVVNWDLASSATDYLAAENAPSPVQHFWSLAVEEQFYVMWPLVIAGLTWLGWRAKVRARTVLLPAVALIVGSSLVYSILATAEDPARAYFVTPTRIWELGFGALLAITFWGRTWTERNGHLRRPDALAGPLWARQLVALAGLAAIVYAAFSYNETTPFPGWHALVPVLGTVAVIAANVDRSTAELTGTDTSGLAGRALATGPMQWLGDISYSVYLWHWPLVVLVPYQTGRDLTFSDKLIILGVSLHLAWLTKMFVEDRFRRPIWGRPLGKPFLYGGTAMGVIVALAGLLTVDYQRERVEAQTELRQALAGSQDCFGAAALVQGDDDCARTVRGPVVPAPAEATLDKSDAYDDGCWVYKPFTATRTCSYAVADAPLRVALVGNSHAGQWLPALQEVAKERRWSLTTFLASECTPSDTAVRWESDALTENCLGWAERVQTATIDGDFDLIVVSSRSGRPAAGFADIAASTASYQEGYRSYLQTWIDAGERVLVLRDTPFPGGSVGNVPDCIALHPDDLTVCAADRAAAEPIDPLLDAAVDLGHPRVATLDLNNFICAAATCDAAVGGVTTYFDGSHLTATYVRTLTDQLRPALLAGVRATVRAERASSTS